MVDNHAEFYNKAKQIAFNNSCIFPNKKKFALTYQKINFGWKDEPMERVIIKTVISKLLKEQNFKFLSESVMCNNGKFYCKGCKTEHIRKIPILDIDNARMFCFDSPKFYKIKIKKVFIDLDNLPDEIGESLNKIEEWCKQWVTTTGKGQDIQKQRNY